MEGKILAALLLLLGGSVTVYILYRAMFAVVEPVVTKKLEQQMTKDKLSQLQNNLVLHKQVDQQAVQQIQNNMKK
ncbi:hypothetical protein Tfer_1672 [Thermincola ferriacetica]|uniref:Uncharacterized protein n=1 Tax=Thermincola ferriacetica TaxID=281456 RepID=A0A0L6W2F9_9FIRM|nr:hypothetical protein [Thermincola ferriacetica]KNZ69651.1 hypothetical protein Tfer_1672 [Thermincola ferriacetica]